MRRFFTLAVFTLLWLGALPAGAAEGTTAEPTASDPPGMEGWHSSLSAALEEAAETDSYILVDLFADWCGWCKVLEEKVFSTAKFKSFAKENKLVLLRVDTEDEGEGSGLQTRYQAYNLPTTLIIDSNFVNIGKISGFAPIDEFLQYVVQQIDAWKTVGSNYKLVLDSNDANLKRQVAEELHKRGDGVRAAKLYDSVIEQVVPGTDAFVWLHYMKADAYRMARKFDDASAALKRTKELMTSLEDTAELKERVDLLTFYIAKDNGTCQQALSSAKSFLESHPESSMRRVMERTRRELELSESCI